MTAFDHAWTLLKQRGHEIYRPEMEQDENENLQGLIDARVSEANRRQNLINQLMRELSKPMANYSMVDVNNLLYLIEESNMFDEDYKQEIDAASRSMGPMVDLQRQQEAEEIEAMGVPDIVYDTENGVSRPDFSDEDLLFEPTERPPANIGMAGSLTPAPFRPDLEQLRQSMTPLGQALTKVRAGSGPQPLQFDQ